MRNGRVDLTQSSQRKRTEGTEKSVRFEEIQKGRGGVLDGEWLNLVGVVCEENARSGTEVL